jgi:hypothetical protein
MHIPPDLHGQTVANLLLGHRLRVSRRSYHLYWPHHISMYANQLSLEQDNTTRRSLLQPGDHVAVWKSPEYHNRRYDAGTTNAIDMETSHVDESESWSLDYVRPGKHVSNHS